MEHLFNILLPNQAVMIVFNQDINFYHKPYRGLYRLNLKQKNFSTFLQESYETTVYSHHI